MLRRGHTCRGGLLKGILMSRWFQRFQPLGGTSRRYLDKQTGRTLSRRRFLRYQGICPELRAAQRRTEGLGFSRKTRCDKGQPRAMQHGTVVLTARGSVLLRTMPGAANAFAVQRDGIQIAVIQRVPHGHWDRWRCETCQLQLRSELAIIEHAISVHYSSSCQAHGVAASSLSFVGHVAAHERRTRMPWRVKLPEQS